VEIHQTPTIEIKDDLLREKGIKLFIKREDLIHPIVSGNKWRKLKYNLIEASRLGHDCLLTFGGAYSNHIAAVAGAGKEAGFNTIGIIRGEEHLPLNPTLAFATECGMKLIYIDRTAYRNKDQPEFITQLKKEHAPFYLIPEGGTNELAIQGCEEIVSDIEAPFDVLCCPVGTGGTITGLISGLDGAKQVLGFSALKGDFLRSDVKSLLEKYRKPYSNWKINTDYHFGGYAKLKTELIDFILAFESKHKIPLEPIYTGKMMFGIMDMVKKNQFQPGTTILAIHTGGLQGNAGFDFRKNN
jgi:1-aminocyclopropane-1-carboxylate deaminase/D-cysteine desulfhydrase-like pyridoxal-dependent ACC family enzyme